MTRTLTTGTLTARPLILLIVLASAACTPRPRPAARSTTTATTTTTAAPPALPQVRDARTLGERLAAERAARPAGTLRPEDVAGALEKAGIAVAPIAQVLASTVGARYCAATTTAAGLAVAVCEFADTADAERGLAYSRRTFDRLIPGRTLARNRATVLTLTTPAARGPEREAPAEAYRAAAIFAAL